MRRKMYGWMRRFSWVSIPGSLFMMGFSYSLTNFEWVKRYPGITKSKMDQISEREFSIGVPVRANRVSVFRFLTLWAFMDALFLIFCASSMITAENSISL